jgi:hypothetical protein
MNSVIGKAINGKLPKKSWIASSLTLLAMTNLWHTLSSTTPSLRAKRSNPGLFGLLSPWRSLRRSLGRSSGSLAMTEGY